jgi:hypothetical protein
MPRLRKHLILGCLLAIILLGCNRARYFNFEELGGFKFPESFAEQEYYSSSTIEHLRGKMAVTDAKAIVNAGHGFRRAILPTDTVPAEAVASWPKYALHNNDKERKTVMHLDIATGEFDGFVTFPNSVGGDSHKSFRR